MKTKNSFMQRLLLMLVSLVCAGQVSAYDFFQFKVENSDGVAIYYQTNGQSEVVVANDMYDKNQKYAGNVRIPSTVSWGGKDYTVTGINNYCFYDCASLQSVNMPETIKAIGVGAFNGCVSLTHISVPSLVTQIEDYTFMDCTNLQSVDLPNSIVAIGSFAFSSCDALKSITLPKSLKSINAQAFFNSDNIKEVISLIEVPFYVKCFSDIKKKATLYVPNGTKEAYKNTEGWEFSVIREIGEEPTSIIVTVTDCSRPYGDENPKFEYTVEGGVLEGEPELTCTAYAWSDVGEYVITARKGSITNDDVTFINGTMTIEKAPLLIKADDKEMIAGDKLPKFTATYTGFKRSDNATYDLTKQPQLKCEAKSESAPGTYDIIPYGAEAKNYEISYEKGTLTILPMIVVRAKDCSREYGDENPKLEYTVEGGELDGEPELSCNAYSWSDVGEYTITIRKGSIKKQNVTFINGIMTIEKAPLLIKADDKEMIAGDKLPKFTATYTGFKRSEYASYYLTTQAQFQCEANSESAPGTYDITPYGAEAKNYEISYEKGTLTILPMIVVRAKDCSREYGDENPKLEYTVEGGELDGEPELSCNAYSWSDVGEYTITIRKGSIKKENVTFINGIMTIEKAPLLIKADDKEMIAGDKLPKFTATYTGFKRSEYASYYLTTQAQFQCEANSESAPGTYDIIPYGAEAKNYEISYINGTLTIIDPVGINDIQSANSESTWYNLQGSRLSGKPTQKGIYLHNGHKVLVK